MTKSTHEVIVVKLGEIKRHPNADTLEMTNIWNYQVIFKEGQYKTGDLVAYIPPDSIVDTTRPEFEWLGEHRRIKVRRFRQLWSMGLITPAPAGSKEGDNVADQLGIIHFDPDEYTREGKPKERANHSGPLVSGRASAQPRILPKGISMPRYDLDSWYRFGDILKEGESVLVTEKIHGANARFVYVPDRRGLLQKAWDWTVKLLTDFSSGPPKQRYGLFTGSRNTWKDPLQDHAWSRALKAQPSIGQFCVANPNVVLYGEVYGDGVQELKYGLDHGEVRFVAFDAFDCNAMNWVPQRLLRSIAHGVGLQMAPLLYEGPYEKEKMPEFAEGKSTLPGANHVREGCVVESLDNPRNSHGFRHKLKIVGNGYLEKA